MLKMVANRRRGLLDPHRHWWAEQLFRSRVVRSADRDGPRGHDCGYPTRSAPSTPGLRTPPRYYALRTGSTHVEEPHMAPSAPQNRNSQTCHSAGTPWPLRPPKSYSVASSRRVRRHVSTMGVGPISGLGGIHNRTAIPLPKRARHDASRRARQWGHREWADARPPRRVRVYHFIARGAGERSRQKISPLIETRSSGAPQTTCTHARQRVELGSDPQRLQVATTSWSRTSLGDGRPARRPLPAPSAPPPPASW